jgi:hypothetical protein
MVVAIPFAKPAMLWLDFLPLHAHTAPIGLENLGLRNEGWRLALKSLDSRACSGLGLAVTGDAGSLYPFWPEDSIRCTSAFWFLSR